jgi:hypothetical protein
VEAEEVLIYQWQGPKIVTPSAKEAISALDADRRAGSRSHRRRWPAGHHRRVLLAVTIIGIPFAWAHLELAGIALWPIGKTIVPADEAAFHYARRS